MPTRPVTLVGLEVDELGGLAAHLEHRGDVGMKRAYGAGDGSELVLVGQVEQGAHQLAAGAGDAYLGDGVCGQRGHDLLQQLAGRLGGAALDALVGGDEYGRRVGMGRTRPLAMGL